MGSRTPSKRSTRSHSTSSSASNARTPTLSELLQRADRLTRAENTELSTLLTRVCGIVLDAPPKVQASLSLLNRLSLYRAFIAQSDLGVRIAAPGAPSARPRRTPKR